MTTEHTDWTGNREMYWNLHSDARHGSVAGTARCFYLKSDTPDDAGRTWGATPMILIETPDGKLLHVPCSMVSTKPVEKSKTPAVR